MSPSKPSGWRPEQMKPLHRYARFAGFATERGAAGRHTWEAWLASHTACGARSARDPRLHQDDYEAVMAALEALAEQRVLAGELVWPEGLDIAWWRRRRPARGKANSRQIHELADLWKQLVSYLPREQRNLGYLLAVLSRALGYEVADPSALDASAASLAIDCLRGKLRQAIRKANREG